MSAAASPVLVGLVDAGVLPAFADRIAEERDFSASPSPACGGGLGWGQPASEKSNRCADGNTPTPALPRAPRGGGRDPRSGRVGVSPQESDPTPAESPGLGHGVALARLILDGAPACRLLVARVFFDRLHTTPRQVAAAIDWLGEAGAAVINLSLGLTANRSVLEDACRAARDRGQLLVASSPARGPVPYPAAYPGVIRVTGDARCRPGELSALNSWQADFGACVAIRGGGLAGASLATARVTAAIAALLAEGTAATPDAVRAALTARAAYHGPEQRSAADPAG